MQQYIRMLSILCYIRIPQFYGVRNMQKQFKSAVWYVEHIKGLSGRLYKGCEENITNLSTGIK
jgi:hypothetical protein